MSNGRNDKGEVMERERQGKIWKLSSTRVWRTYIGGEKIETWLGSNDPKDSEFPEVWIASTTEARNSEKESIRNEGLSEVVFDNSEGVLLKTIIEGNPELYLGRTHYEKFGSNLSVLTKIIDSLGRLTIQVHPDKRFAKDILDSEYGKTEAWYILGGRRVNGEEPYVLMGFKPGITREKWKRLFDEQNVEGMIASLNKVYVKPGEVYFIEGGVPHAIGSGCFLIEIQEPTDYTMRVEKMTPEGKDIPDILCHQGAGFDRMFDCFHYDTFTEDELLKRWKIKPKDIYKDQEAEETILIGDDTTTLFGLSKLLVRGKHVKKMGPNFSTMIVLSGAGDISNGDWKLRVKQGEIFFVPATIDTLDIDALNGNDLELVFCYPPH